MKANEIILAPLIAAPVLKASGGDMVIIYNTPEGQIPMFWTRSWGKNMGGRGWYARQRLPPNTKRLDGNDAASGEGGRRLHGAGETC